MRSGPVANRDTVHQVGSFAPPGQGALLFLVIDHDKFTLHGAQLIGNPLAANRKEELLGGKGNIGVALHAAQDHFAFIGFEDVALAREFL